MSVVETELEYPGRDQRAGRREQRARGRSYWDDDRARGLLQKAEEDGGPGLWSLLRTEKLESGSSLRSAHVRTWGVGQVAWLPVPQSSCLNVTALLTRVRGMDRTTSEAHLHTVGAQKTAQLCANSDWSVCKP